MATSRHSSKPSSPKPPPAKTPQAREDQMISLAVDLAEKQLRDGTASTQVISHYLKLATSREEKEQHRLALEHKLLEARVENLNAVTNQDVMAKKAYNAFRGYAGLDPDPETDDEDYDY